MDESLTYGNFIYATFFFARLPFLVCSISFLTIIGIVCLGLVTPPLQFFFFFFFSAFSSIVKISDIRRPLRAKLGEIMHRKKKGIALKSKMKLFWGFFREAKLIIN